MLRTSFGACRRRFGAPRIDVAVLVNPASYRQIRRSNIQSGTCCAPNTVSNRRKQADPADYSRLSIALRKIEKAHCFPSSWIGNCSSMIHSIDIRPVVVDISLSRQRTRHFRWMSSSSGKKESSSEKTSKPEKPETERGRLSSIVSSVGPTLRRVTEWNLGDLMSVYGIVALILLIAFSPFVIEEMRKAARSEYGDIDEYDPVAHGEKIVRYELFGEERDEGQEENEVAKNGNTARRSVDNTVDMAADVLKSKALQEAIASLITRVLDSVQFQNACQTLLKNLWNDLVTDAETTAQVVQLLNNAIQNKEIQRSVRKLVLQIIKDKEVYDELTRLLVRLSQEDQVLDATRSLLTESAHNALNDPEILDHSMEFATDVAGDDIVQQTSGEALRNTVSHAVRPGVSVFLTVLGVGLLIFSISAFGRSGASEQDAAFVDKAFESMARSVHVGVREAVSSLASVPGRILSTFLAVVTFPFRVAERTVAGIGRAGRTFASAVSGVFHSIHALPVAIFRTALSILQRCGRFLSDEVALSLLKFQSAISASFIGSATRSVSKTSAAVVSAIARALDIASGFVLTGAATVGSTLSILRGAVASALSTISIFIAATTVKGGEFAAVLASNLVVYSSQCSALVKPGLSALATKSASAQTAVSELVALATAQWAKVGAHAASAVAARSKEMGTKLATAREHVSTALAAIAAWCMYLFRGDGNSDSASSTIS